MTWEEPIGRHGTPRVPCTGEPGPASPTSGCNCARRLCTARMYGCIHGWDVASLAKEWRVEANWEIVRIEAA